MDKNCCSDTGRGNFSQPRDGCHRGMGGGSVLLGLLGAATSDNQFLEMAGYLLIAIFGGIAWVTLVLIRVSAYRRTGPSIGI